MGFLLSQKKGPKRSLKPQKITGFHGCEDLFGKMPIRHPSYMELQIFAFGCSVGDGKTAAPAIAQQNINVLTGQVLKGLVLRQLQLYDHDVVADFFKMDDPAG